VQISLTTPQYQAKHTSTIFPTSDYHSWAVTKTIDCQLEVLNKENSATQVLQKIAI
jgi:hypothetical protein